MWQRFASRAGGSSPLLPHPPKDDLDEVSDMTDSKTCIKCATDKPLGEYYTRSSGKLSNTCKGCVKTAQKKRYSDNREKIRAATRRYRENNIDERRKKEREYSRRNAAARDARVKAFHKANPHKASEYSRTYARSDKGKKQASRYYRDKLSNCDDFKAATAARNMLKRTLMATGSGKKGSTFKTIGYGPSDLKRHLESRFSDGMSWENYGAWQIDHIIPVAEMVRLGITCAKRINALSNLRPVWASENLSKGDRFVLVAQYQP